MFCPVHLSLMTLEAVPIVYGLFEWRPGARETAAALFPFAHVTVLGPDCVEAATTRTVPVCSECRIVESKWEGERVVARADWDGTFFRTTDALTAPANRGLILIGTASSEEVPWPDIGMHVEVVESGCGVVAVVEVLGIDHSFTLPCFSDNSAMRAILVASESLSLPTLGGGFVRRLRRPGRDGPTGR